MPGPASCCGRSTPCRAPANRASRRGKATAGRTAPGTNVWSFFTIDTERGIVYAPIGAPTSDYYGGDRNGANLYGNSVVALDATTGKLKWHQQLVHHDIWDYDVPAAPTLVDVKRNGKTTPAVAVMTKMSLVFIFDRVTGEPIFGIEERPVPQSGVPGEKTWPTQPFPLKPAPLARNTFDPAKDFYNLTPEHAAYCKELWDDNAMYTKGPYTPPDVEGTMLTFPSTLGGGNWSGFSYDPTLGLAFTSVMNIGQVAKMVQGTARGGGPATWVRRSPWGGAVGRFWNPETKIPCSARPFGELVAVDVNRGEVAWKVPLGFVESLKDEGLRQDRHAEHRRQHRDRRRRASSSARRSTAASARSSRRPASSCGKRSCRPARTPRR